MQQSPSAEPAAIALLEGHRGVYRQDDLSGVLSATVKGADRLGSPVYLALLLHDGGLDAWYVAAFLDAAGTPPPPGEEVLPAGPFPFSPAPGVSGGPLLQVMGEAWGAERCAGLERRLGIAAALCVTIAGAGGTRGALLALLPSAERAPLLAGLLTHAATAAARHFHAAGASEGTTVLDPAVFAARADDEIARAERHNRELTLALFSPRSAAERARVAVALDRHLQRWDLLGRAGGDEPALAVILPETSRAAGQVFLTRLSASLAGVPVGLATFPHDGISLASLIATARGRATVEVPAHLPRVPVRDGSIWLRGAPAGPGSDMVRCPLCLATYARWLGADVSGEEAEEMRVLARAELQRDCPRHETRVTVAHTGRPAATGSRARDWLGARGRVA